MRWTAWEISTWVLAKNYTLAPMTTRACHHIWPTILRDGQFVPFDWKNIRDLLRKDARLSRKKGHRIVWLTRGLTGTGLLMVIITQGLVGWTLTHIRSERTQASYQQGQLNRRIRINLRSSLPTVSRRSKTSSTAMPFTLTTKGP